MKEGAWKDILFVGGFASIFNIAGSILLLLFSTGTQLDCDRWKDTCHLQYEYTFQAPEEKTWRLSEMHSVYVSTSYPKGTPQETRNQKPTHRAVMRLKSGEMIPLMPYYTSDKASQEAFVDALTTYLSTDSLSAGENGRFQRIVDGDWMIWVAWMLNAVGLLIAVWGWWLSRSRN